MKVSKGGRWNKKKQSWKQIKICEEKKTKLKCPKEKWFSMLWIQLPSLLAQKRSLATKS